MFCVNEFFLYYLCIWFFFNYKGAKSKDFTWFIKYFIFVPKLIHVFICIHGIMNLFCIRLLLLHEAIVIAQGGYYYILKMSTRLRRFCHKVVMAMDLSFLAGIWGNDFCWKTFFGSCKWKIFKFKFAWKSMCKENLISMGTLIQLEMLGKFWNKKVEKVVDMIVKN